MTGCPISVIMPAKNAEPFIADALRSVILQEWPLVEVLIVDDGSDDGTMGIVETFLGALPEIRILDGPGRGPGPARNLALESAKGEVIAFLDAEDLWPKGKLEAQAARVQRDPAPDVVSGSVRWFERQSPTGLVPAADTRTRDMLCVNLGAALFRRSVFDCIGVFDEKFTYGEDLDFFMRIREAEIPMVILPQPTLYYRRHPGSKTYAYTDREKGDFGRALAMSIMRRRRLGKMADLAPLESYVEPAGPGPIR